MWNRSFSCYALVKDLVALLPPQEHGASLLTALIRQFPARDICELVEIRKSHYLLIFNMRLGRKYKYKHP